VADDEGRGPEAALERSLARMRVALASATEGRAGPVLPVARLSPEGRLGALLLALSAGSLLLLAGTTAWPFLGLAVAFGVSGGLFLGRGLTQRHLAPSGGPAHIGMGASVSSSAVVEPGAVVEMGATVKSGAIVRSGAVVGMGATVGTNALIENGAVVSWGGTVRAGATVGANAVVGWGATVGKGVQVPPGMRLRAGATVSAGWLREHWPGGQVQRPLPAARDPAAERATAACDRLTAELRAASEHVRAFLGTSEATISSLRRTCEDLLQREQALRMEVDPSALGRLDDERKDLEARLASASDESLRRSLTGAVAAIDGQRRQRELLRLSADRLQAERLRLVYTLEGLASQFVRLRTAGAEAGRASTAGLEQGVRDLGAELDAIADALEQESQNVPPTTPRVRG
jgi:carbonic anhydrase/acetyltransferase-like protein (isoleucine patch superfamily)